MNGRPAGTASQRHGATAPATTASEEVRTTVSDELERWLSGPGEKTLGSLIELFEEKSFALVFVLLLGVPALPLPTGGATHVFEIIAVLLALQLIAGRDADLAAAALARARARRRTRRSASSRA